MSKLNYALIGCGRISPNHLAAAENNISDLNIKAVCDIQPQRVESALSKLKTTEAKGYTDYRELLKKEKPKLVAIATESGKHPEIALDCIEAGCNVIIEKPIALSIEDADKIIQAAEAKGVVVSACHQNRFNKSIRKIRQAIETGRFGKLLFGVANIFWNRNQNYYKGDDWRGTWEMDGGALMNQCIHNIDLLRWMLGDEVDEVFAYTDNLLHPYIEAEDLGLAVIRFKNGSYGTIQGTTDIFPSNLEETLYIFGEKGTVKAGGTSVNILEEWRFADGLDDPDLIKKEYGEIPPNVYGFGHTPLYADVIDSIKNSRKPYIDAYAGKRAVEMVLAIYKSALEKKPVKLPLQKASTLDSEGRFRP